MQSTSNNNVINKFSIKMGFSIKHFNDVLYHQLHWMVSNLDTINEMQMQIKPLTLKMYWLWRCEASPIQTDLSRKTASIWKPINSSENPDLIPSYRVQNYKRAAKYNEFSFVSSYLSHSTNLRKKNWFHRFDLSI